MNLKDYIMNVPDYPKAGIQFKDITPLMNNGEAYAYATAEITKFAHEVGAEVVVGPEARGFIFGCPIATEMKIGFAPVRKPGKLPREVISVEYDLEYGTDQITMHKDAIVPGQKVIIVDDLLATGGTIKATIELVERLGGVVAGLAFLVELDDLKGRDKIGAQYPILTLVHY